MKLDRKLNLVLDLELSDGRPAQVHSVPVDDNVCEAHYLFIAVVMTRLYNKLGPNPAACSRVCYHMMKDIIAEGNEYKGAEKSFLQEIWRLTNVAIPGERGWETVPFYECIANPDRYMSQADVREVQNYICFFTAASWLHPRKEREGMYDFLTEYGARTTSSNSTEHISSLPTWKQEESTGANPPAWSPAS